MVDPFVQPPAGRSVAVAYSPRGASPALIEAGDTKEPWCSASAGMGKPTTPTHTRAWEDLRREARKLESELEAKLSAYAKLASSFDSRGFGEAGLAADQLASSKDSAIDDLLRRLSDVNDSMGGTVSGTGDPRTHTLTRHRDVLHDLTQEFRRLRASYGAARDRADLLAGGSGDSSSMLTGQASSGLLLRERGTLQSTNTSLDEVIGTAQAVTGSLGEHRRIFENIGVKLVSVGSKFPMVSGVMNAIRRKKNKDTLVLAGVITLCTLFLLIYWWRK